MERIPSEMTINFIKSFENFRADAYLDVGGVPTIGWGTTKGVRLGMTTTLEQAKVWLLRDVTEVESAIASMIKVPCSENQLCALSSFVYNIGVRRFRNSTLLKKINVGDFAGTAKEFLRWDHVKGIEVQGLLNRREKEHDMFLSTTLPSVVVT